MSRITEAGNKKILMAIFDLVMPKLGESIMEATILKWFKQPGDPVKMDETVLEIATDKVDSEVPSTAAGVIDEILFKVNDVVPIGSVIARIKTSTEEPVSVSQPVQTPPRTQEAEVLETVQHTPREFNHVSSPPKHNSNVSSSRFYSPLVLNIAASEGVSITELETIPGTGNEGRVTKKDILQYVSEKKTGRNTSTTSYQSPAISTQQPIENAGLTTSSSQVSGYS